MKLTNAYIIDGDVIEKRIAELELEANESTVVDWRIVGAITELNLLKQHLKPALPIVDKAYDAGASYGSFSYISKQDFLTKDF